MKKICVNPDEMTMNRKVIKSILIVVFCITLSATAYYWGFLCGKRHIDNLSYDHLANDLTNLILVYDAIKANDFSNVTPLVKNNIELKFGEFVKLYREFDFNSSLQARCAITRRFRKMVIEGEILHNQESLDGYPIEIINQYLDAECLGEPSHTNWVTEE